MHHAVAVRLWGRSRRPPMHGSEELLEALRRREDGAFRQVVEAEADGLYALALGVLGSEDDAEDACQEVFVKLLRGVPRLSSSTPLRAWLRRVCLNHCLDQLRRRRPRRRVDPLGDDVPGIVTWRAPADYCALVAKRARQAGLLGWALTVLGGLALIAGIVKA